MSATEPNQVNSTAPRLSTVFFGSSLLPFSLSLLALGLSVSISLGLVQIIIGVVATPA